jgi:uncharacterized protein YoxC
MLWVYILFPTLSILFVAWALYSLKRDSKMYSDHIVRGSMSETYAPSTQRELGASKNQSALASSSTSVATVSHISEISEKLDRLEDKVDGSRGEISSVTEQMNKILTEFSGQQEKIMENVNSTFYIVSSVYDAIDNLENIVPTQTPYTRRAGKAASGRSGMLLELDPLQAIYGRKKVPGYSDILLSTVTADKATSNVPGNE